MESALGNQENFLHDILDLDPRSSQMARPACDPLVIEGEKLPEVPRHRNVPARAGSLAAGLWFQRQGNFSSQKR
jgi:hypothetical protein